MNLATKRITALACLAFATSAAFAQVVDQQDLVNNAYMAAFSQGDLAQSFMPSVGTCAGASIFLQAGVGGSDNVTISLWDKLPNAGGSMLAQGSVFGTQGSWADVFWSAVAVTPETTYYLVFTGNNTLGIAGDVNNNYSRGQVYANPGFQPFPGFDYTFKEYSVVPEPTTLVAVGLGALLIRRRRK